MKKLIILLIVMMSTMVMSCKKEKIEYQNPNSASTVSESDGTWNLVSISGGLMGVNESFPTGTILWTLNAGDSTLVVEDNSGSQTNYSFPAGTYSFYESEVNGDVFVFVDGDQIGIRSISNDTLTLGADQITMDGFMLEFIR